MKKLTALIMAAVLVPLGAKAEPNEEASPGKPAPNQAGTIKIVARQVTGLGSTTRDAINDGLVRSVEQQFGSQLGTAVTRKLATQFDDSGLSFSEELAPETVRLVEGRVRSYEVHERSCENDLCEVQLSVSFNEYQSSSPANQQKKRLAGSRGWWRDSLTLIKLHSILRTRVFLFGVTNT